jgi:hypothetical protein
MEGVFIIKNLPVAFAKHPCVGNAPTMSSSTPNSVRLLLGVFLSLLPRLALYVDLNFSYSSARLDQHSPAPDVYVIVAESGGHHQIEAINVA